MYAEDGPTVCAFGDIGPKHRVGEEHSYSKLLRWNIRARTFTPPHPWPGHPHGAPPPRRDPHDAVPLAPECPSSSLLYGHRIQAFRFSTGKYRWNGEL